jgi:hypothetical protein
MVNGEEITNLTHVSASDDASIKTVFKGGVTCTTRENLMIDAVNAEVTYCCKVKSYGDTYIWGM